MNFLFSRLNPLNQRRLHQFKSNRRAYISLWFFFISFILALVTPFLANDKPLILMVNEKFYFPIMKSYTDTSFGGEVDRLVDYKDPDFIQSIKQKGGWIIFPLIPYGPQTIQTNESLIFPSAPSSENWLGTDDQGRDVLTRILYGLKTSLFFAILLTLVSASLGTIFGALQGYFGGYIDLIGQRLTEIWSGLPILYVLITLSSMVTPNFWWLLGIMMLFNWMGLSIPVRIEFFKAKTCDYVKAAQAMGLSHWAVMQRHILPNAMIALLTYLPFMLHLSISTLTSLDFLGFGLPPFEPSLGELIIQAKNNLNASWLSLSAFIVIGGLFSVINFIGEGIRDAFDPSGFKKTT